MSTSAYSDALARLDVLVGKWSIEARFPGDSPASANDPEATVAEAHSSFEWILDGRFLVQHSEVSVPEAPNSMSVIYVAPETGDYTQHYYDSRGVVRRYAMSLADGVWQLVRDAPDFSPLDFSQRFTATISDDGTTIEGAWELSDDGSTWNHDFALIYRKVS